MTVDAADFRSLDDAVITGPRNADGSLPDTDFFRLVTGSDLIDRGVDVGLPFRGDAPDLGAFEFGVSAPQTATNGPGRTEAEDMDLEGYEVTDRGGTSGGQAVQVLTTKGIGSVGYRFTGATGTYDLAIRYLDENDGNSTFTLITNDVTTRQWTDDQTPEGASDEWRIQSVRGVRLNQDSRIEIQAGADRGAFARLDYVDVDTVAASSSTVTIRARGATNEERMALIVGGRTVAEWTLQALLRDYTTTTVIDGDVRVAFLNDQVRRDDGVRIDRNLRVDYLTVDGRRYEAENQATNTGVWDAEKSRCGGLRSERIDCNGYIDFDQLGPAAQRTTPGTSGLSAAATSIAVFPNPASGEVTVRTQLPRYALHLFDATGKLVLERGTLQYTVTLDIADVPTGFYTLYISHDGGNVNRKLVIER